MYRGKEYERIGEFVVRIQSQYPSAQVRNRISKPVVETLVYGRACNPFTLNSAKSKTDKCSKITNWVSNEWLHLRVLCIESKVRKLCITQSFILGVEGLTALKTFQQWSCSRICFNSPMQAGSNTCSLVLFSNLICLGKQQLAFRIKAC